MCKVVWGQFGQTEGGHAQGGPKVGQTHCPASDRASAAGSDHPGTPWALSWLRQPRLHREQSASLLVGESVMGRDQATGMLEGVWIANTRATQKTMQRARAKMAAVRAICPRMPGAARRGARGWSIVQGKTNTAFIATRCWTQAGFSAAVRPYRRMTDFHAYEN